MQAIIVITEGCALLVALGAILTLLVLAHVLVVTAQPELDPAEWKPPDVGDWCRYASDWMTVKAWDLSADTAEVQAIQEMLISCQDESG
jgi:hypothetical protein